MKLMSFIATGANGLFCEGLRKSEKEEDVRNGISSEVDDKADL